MAKETSSVVPEIIAPPVPQFNEQEKVTLAALAKLCSQPLPISAEIPQLPLVERRAAAEYKQIKAELRANFE